MSYTLDANQAKSADSLGSSIRETGKYVGTLTRAEAITSTKGTRGLGLSFKSADGATADYLDLWTHNKDGEALSALKTVNAILACLKLRGINEGAITFEKWNKDKKAREQVQGTGYPDLMGKRIGFLLRKELETDDKGEDRERLGIFAVFQADTELTASEVLGQQTKPERLSKMLETLIAKPVHDKRKGAASLNRTASGAGPADSGDWTQDPDIPF